MSRLWKLCAVSPSEALFFFLSVWLLYLPIALPAHLLAPDGKPTDSQPLLHQPLLLLSLSLAWLAACVSGCLAVLVCTSEFWGLVDQLFISYFLFLFLYTFTQTDRHTLSLTQLISPSLAHSSGRMWPCLIVYRAHLFSLHDVTIAYLFSSGLPSHIKMIDSFHSLHIFKLYLISSFPLAFKSLLFPCLKVIMLPRHIIIHTLDCFFHLIICVRK